MMDGTNGHYWINDGGNDMVCTLTHKKIKDFEEKGDEYCMISLGKSFGISFIAQFPKRVDTECNSN